MRIRGVVSPPGYVASAQGTSRCKQGKVGPRKQRRRLRREAKTGPTGAGERVRGGAGAGSGPAGEGGWGEGGAAW